MIEIVDSNQGAELISGSSSEARPSMKVADAPLVQEDPMTAPAIKGELSKGKRWLISAVTGSAMLVGAGLMTVGIVSSKEDDDSSPSSGDVTQNDGNEYVSPPFLERFSGLVSAENIFNKDNIRIMSKVELSQLEAKGNGNSEIKLFPIPFNPEGQNIKSNLFEVSFDGKTEPTTGVLTFSGVETGTEVISPISGEIEIRDLEIPGRPTQKIVTIRRTQNGQVLIMQFFAPSDIQMAFDLTEKSSLKAGEPLFAYGETTKISENPGQSLEIHSLIKKEGEEDTQAVTQGLNIITEQGRALFLK